MDYSTSKFTERKEIFLAREIFRLSKCRKILLTNGKEIFLCVKLFKEPWMSGRSDSWDVPKSHVINTCVKKCNRYCISLNWSHLATEPDCPLQFCPSIAPDGDLAIRHSSSSAGYFTLCRSDIKVEWPWRGVLRGEGAAPRCRLKQSFPRVVRGGKGLSWGPFGA